MKDVDYGRPRQDTCEYNPILELERNGEPKGVEGVVQRVKHHALLSSVQVHYKVRNVNKGARPP
jgi:hypothetical protein